LCWKENVNIDGILEDFEERAAQKYSKWICKCNKQATFTGDRQAGEQAPRC